MLCGDVNRGIHRLFVRLPSQELSNHCRITIARCLRQHVLISLIRRSQKRATMGHKTTEQIRFPPKMEKNLEGVCACSNSEHGG